MSQDPRVDEDLDILGIVASEVFEDGKSDNEEGWGEEQENSQQFKQGYYSRSSN